MTVSALTINSLKSLKGQRLLPDAGFLIISSHEYPMPLSAIGAACRERRNL